MAFIFAISLVLHGSRGSGELHGSPSGFKEASDLQSRGSDVVGDTLTQIFFLLYNYENSRNCTYRLCLAVFDLFFGLLGCCSVTSTLKISSDDSSTVVNLIFTFLEK